MQMEATCRYIFPYKANDRKPDGLVRSGLRGRVYLEDRLLDSAGRQDTAQEQGDPPRHQERQHLLREQQCQVGRPQCLQTHRKRTVLHQHRYALLHCSRNLEGTAVRQQMRYLVDWLRHLLAVLPQAGLQSVRLPLALPQGPQRRIRPHSVHLLGQYEGTCAHVPYFRTRNASVGF